MKIPTRAVPLVWENKIIQGDALATLRKLPAGIAQMCMTSPPYWGLRDYGTGVWVGGAAGCNHLKPPGGGRTKGKLLNGPGNREGYSSDGQFNNICPRCGARRTDEQIGLEPEPGAYIARLVEVFREVHRVLRDDGTLWLNLGDSWAGSGKGRNADGSPNAKGKQATNRGTIEGTLFHTRAYRPGAARADGVIDRAIRNRNGAGQVANLPAKNLIGIPWRVAFALQADGWVLRQDIIWAKPNSMPEPVKDRCTKSHEYIFLFSKNARYHFDTAAIQEASVTLKGPGRMRFNAEDAAARSVWVIPTQPYKGAHFATFPEALVERCILAGAPSDGVVLDPFMGSGTVGKVALDLGRRFTGVELSPAYIALACGRLRGNYE